MRKRFFKVLALVMALMIMLPTAGLAGNYDIKNQSQNAVKGQSKNTIKKTKKGKVDKEKGRKKPKKVAHISLNKKSMTLSVGASQKLVAVITPPDATDKKVIWGTTDQAVATVDQQGVVTGVKTGMAIVYAIAVNGYKMATCTVQVVDGSGSVGGNIPEVTITAVSINKTTSNVSVKAGSTKTLSVTVTPENATNKRVSWSSSNLDAATVDQAGNVYGRAEGSAIITVTSEDGRKSDSCVVNVIPDSKWVSVRGISLNLVQTAIPVGFKDTLRYRIEPSNASDTEVRWSSSNNNVATVNLRGEVTAIAPGNVIISARSVDGGKYAGCIVAVVPSGERPTNGIALNKLSSIIVQGEKDYPIPTLYPSSSIISGLTWSSSDTTVAAVNGNGEVTGVGRGSAVITVIAPGNYRASYTIVVI